MPKTLLFAATLPDAPLSVNAPLAILPRLDELMRCAARIRGPESVEELHATRIAAKRLRYTVEIFAEALEGSEDTLRLLKRFQDLLGELHDADVLAPLLQKDVHHGRPAGVQALHDRTVRDRARLYDAFTAAWTEAHDAGFPARLRAAALAAASGEAATEPDGIEAEARALLAIAHHRIGAWSPSDRRRLAESLEALNAALSPADEDREARAEAVRAAVKRLWKLITKTQA